MMTTNAPMSEAEKQGIINRLELSGWLTRDMIEQPTSTGKRPLKSRLACNKPTRPESIMTLNITVWPDALSEETKAEYLSLKKGDRVVVTGTLEINEYQGRVYVNIRPWSIERV